MLTRFFFQKVSKSSRDKGLLRTAILAVKNNFLTGFEQFSNNTSLKR
jgi:hypothetical protein